MAIKMLCLDMDDTLLMDDLTISEQTVDSIKKASQKGIKVVICTGRSIGGIGTYLDLLNLRKEGCYAVCHNGGALYNTCTEELITEELYPKEYYTPIIELGHRYQVDIQAYQASNFYIERETDRTYRYSKKMNVKATIIPDMSVMDSPLSKILLNGDPSVLRELEPEAAQKVKGKLNYFFSKPEFLEFTALNATKGHMMMNLANRLHIKSEEIIAIGDSYNDIHMIQMAGIGVAVENAHEDIKAVADYVTKQDNNHGAVKEVIDKFILA